MRFLERVRFENDLRNAIDRNELSMHYQPLVDLQDGGLLGFEALLRWHHSEFGNIPPNKFIPDRRRIRPHHPDHGLDPAGNDQPVGEMAKDQPGIQGPDRQRQYLGQAPVQ